eukprot:TRINITY_DN1937_c0_g1_i2.p1 TRINITY_DN1937_c0_g1~~TRINITY_DN1937_c0_g1_i2.p1  ORF type:complete len:333 (+),score=66.76 TRINITY_DN1937_c0_g1_i2:505-1503(+)
MESECYHFERESIPGCYVAHYDASWISDIDDITEDMFGGIDIDKLPEISIDPSSLLLSVINSNKSFAKSFNITIGGSALPVMTEDDTVLVPGETKDNQGNTSTCITLILLIKPLQIMDVCYLNNAPKIFNEVHISEDAYIFSDIKLLNHPISKEQVGHINLDFPLDRSSGPYLCSQSFGGQFTHIFPGNYHAIDLECEIGTNILAVSNGKVVDVKDTERNEGIHTANLFHWNSLLLETEDGYFVEYVHIQTNSALVQVGDIVTRGEIICKSGAVGFAPKPHLHIQLARSSDDDAVTIPIHLNCKEVRMDHIYNEADDQCHSFIELKSGSWYI